MLYQRRRPRVAVLLILTSCAGLIDVAMAQGRQRGAGSTPSTAGSLSVGDYTTDLVPPSALRLTQPLYTGDILRLGIFKFPSFKPSGDLQVCLLADTTDDQFAAEAVSSCSGSTNSASLPDATPTLSRVVFLTYTGASGSALLYLTSPSGPSAFANGTSALVHDYQQWSQFQLGAPALTLAGRNVTGSAPVLRPDGSPAPDGTRVRLVQNGRAVAFGASAGGRATIGTRLSKSSVGKVSSLQMCVETWSTPSIQARPQATTSCTAPVARRVPSR